MLKGCRVGVLVLVSRIRLLTLNYFIRITLLISARVLLLIGIASILTHILLARVLMLIGRGAWVLMLELFIFGVYFRFFSIIFRLLMLRPITISHWVIWLPRATQNELSRSTLYLLNLIIKDWNASGRVSIVISMDATPTRVLIEDII